MCVKYLNNNNDEDNNNNNNNNNNNTVLQMVKIWVAWANFVETGGIYRVSQEECARLREGVPYAKL